MAKTVLIFGLISGAIAAALMWIMLAVMKTGVINLDNGEFFGYATMIISLSLVFFGIKSYRDKNGGRIGFWRGLAVGLSITLISTACYAASWEIYVRTSNSDFMQEYSAHYIEKMKEKGSSAEEVAAASKQMEYMGELYKNPLIRFGMTSMEILPVGILVTLISAALLRKQNVLPAQPA